MKRNWKIWIPLALALSMAIGIVLGGFFVLRSVNGGGEVVSVSTKGLSKIQTILGLINEDYVDNVNIDSITEDIIPKILSDLDPHTAYIPKEDLQDVDDQLQGSFSGIGVQFNIQQDTVVVISVIHSGPSEKLGILPGDRIVSVNGKPFIGKSVTEEKVLKTLKGKTGTHVKIGISRSSSSKLLSFNVERGIVPVKSVDIAYMATHDIAYIRVSSFGAQTYKEFQQALTQVKNHGAKKFIIDLRGNPGGYLDAVIGMVNEFLSKGDLIVYTKGKAYPRSDAKADGNGTCQHAPVVVLIDEFSASASEIFSGAIQDNDRGLIIGRRSFGKGLVQNQIPFSDGSALRLTIARYYTPSGRCIQKPYKHGDTEDYNKELVNRYLHGEFSNKDSIKLSSRLKYKTKRGRTVYGGGGIMPDIFVPSDTKGITPYYNKIVNAGLLSEFAFRYADQHRKTLTKFRKWTELENYLQRQALLMDFSNYAEMRGVHKNVHQIVDSESLIQKSLFAFIARDAVGDNMFYPIVNSTDQCVITAISHLQKKRRR